MAATASLSEKIPTLPPFVDEGEGRLMMAMKFFELGRLSLGQAAQLAGYSKAGFIDVLAHHNIPVVNYSPSELASEIEPKNGS